MKYPRETIFITGASGFVGPKILKELLSKNYNIVALLRNSNLNTTGERLEKIFQKSGISSFYINRVNILTGDISKKNLGIEEHEINFLKEKISEIWHLAASLSFRRRDRGKNFSANVEGTKNIINFAKIIGTKRIFYMSTAYIHGFSNGIMYEKPIKKPLKFNNSYEETKWEAENQIIEYSKKYNTTAIIFRPSIIVGDDKYIPENNFGYYNFLYSIYSLKNSAINLPKFFRIVLRIFSIKIEEKKIYSKIPFPCARDKNLNLIPIGKLLYLISKISEHHREKKERGVFIYNLIDPNPPTLTILFYKTFRGLGLHVPIIHSPLFLLKFVFSIIILSANFLPQLKPFAKSLFYYQQYIFNEARYNINNVKNVVGEKISDESFLTSEKIQKIIKGFLAKQ